MLASFDPASSSATGRTRTAFLRLGYAVLEGLVDHEALGAAAREVDRLARGPHDPSCLRPNNTLVPLRWNDCLVELILSSEDRIEAVRDAVAAADLRWISGYVSIKEAESAPLWWHQDWWCWDHPISYQPAAAQIALLCYLSATDTETGALRVLPGSHLKSTQLHVTLPEAHDSTSPNPDHPAMTDHPDQVTLALAAGDAVVIDYRLLHGTHPNRSGSRRDCVLLSFTPSWRDLPEDIQGHLVRHPAQPTWAENSVGRAATLLPTFEGTPKDLPLNRVPPMEFTISA